MHHTADPINDGIARPGQEWSYERPVAVVVGALVVAAQGSLVTPHTEQHELGWTVAGEDAELDAVHLGAAGVGQLGEERAQFSGEASTSVDVGHQDGLDGHRKPRV